MFCRQNARSGQLAEFEIKFNDTVDKFIANRESGGENKETESPENDNTFRSLPPDQDHNLANEEDQENSDICLLRTRKFLLLNELSNKDLVISV